MLRRRFLPSSPLIYTPKRRRCDRHTRPRQSVHCTRCTRDYGGHTKGSWPCACPCSFALPNLCLLCSLDFHTPPTLLLHALRRTTRPIYSTRTHAHIPEHTPSILNYDLVPNSHALTRQLANSPTSITDWPTRTTQELNFVSLPHLCSSHTPVTAHYGSPPARSLAVPR